MKDPVPGWRPSQAACAWGVLLGLSVLPFLLMMSKAFPKEDTIWNVLMAAAAALFFASALAYLPMRRSRAIPQEVGASGPPAVAPERAGPARLEMAKAGEKEYARVEPALAEPAVDPQEALAAMVPVEPAKDAGEPGAAPGDGVPGADASRSNPESRRRRKRRSTGAGDKVRVRASP